MLKNSGERTYLLYFVFGLRKSLFLTIKYDITYRFYVIILYQTEEVPLYSYFIKQFYHECGLDFVECFFHVC